MWKRVWQTYLMVVLMVYAWPVHASDELREYSYSPSQILKFEYFMDRFIIVTATVNGTHTGRYLLDTGGGLILLNQALADSIGLTPIGTFTGHSAQGTSFTATLATLESFAVGSQTMHNLSVGGFEIPKDPRNIVGIIGGRFFEEFIITIDYPNRVIYFENEEPLRRRRQAGFITPVTIDRYRKWGLDFYLPILLNNKWVREYEVDTGRYSCMMKDDDLPLLMESIQSAQEQGITPTIPLCLLDYPQIRVDLSRNLKADQAIKDGLLGNSFLEHYIVTFNIRDGYMIFAEPKIP